jgi:hypothetical protein
VISSRGAAAGAGGRGGVMCSPIASARCTASAYNTVSASRLLAGVAGAGGRTGA